MRKLYAAVLLKVDFLVFKVPLCDVSIESLVSHFIPNGLETIYYCLFCILLSTIQCSIRVFMSPIHSLLFFLQSCLYCWDLIVFVISLCLIFLLLVLELIELLFTEHGVEFGIFLALCLQFFFCHIVN